VFARVGFSLLFFRFALFFADWGIEFKVGE